MSAFTPKRFWKDVSTVAVEGGYGVMLDQFPLKTPRKRLVVMPARELAQEIVQEWLAVDEKIEKATMPYTRFAEAVIDAAQEERAEIVAKLGLYGGHDLLCYRADSPEELRVRQAGAWDPLLDWAQAQFGVRLNVTSGIVSIAQQESGIAVLMAEIDKLDAYRLTALYDLVTLSGSLVLGLAVVSGHLSAESCWVISRIDEQWQQEQWGEDDEAQAFAESRRRVFLTAGRVVAVLSR